MRSKIYIFCSMKWDTLYDVNKMCSRKFCCRKGRIMPLLRRGYVVTKWNIAFGFLDKQNFNQFVWEKTHYMAYIWHIFRCKFELFVCSTQHVHCDTSCCGLDFFACWRVKRAQFLRLRWWLYLPRVKKHLEWLCGLDEGLTQLLLRLGDKIRLAGLFF